MERTIIAYLKVDDNRAFQEIGDGPIAYLVKEFAQLEQRGILIQDAAIARRGCGRTKRSISCLPCQIRF